MNLRGAFIIFLIWKCIIIRLITTFVGVNNQRYRDMKKKVLGILGGMGPAATADLYGKIVALTEASSDGEHIRTVIDSNVNIPDRTAAILSGGESPLNELEAALDNLVCSGAEVIIIPCNTAHYFLPALKAYAAENYDVECCDAGDTECCADNTECCDASGLCFVSMIEETAKVCAERNPKKAALLATRGTLESGLYQGSLEENGVNYIMPDEEGKDILMDVIYNGVKAGASPESYLPKFAELLNNLKEQGADYFVLACTELPIAFAQLTKLGKSAAADTHLRSVSTVEGERTSGAPRDNAYSVIDPTEELAKAAILACGYSVKKP